MKNLLIGSRALAYFDKSFKLREDADWDVISEKEIEGTEWHKPQHLNNAKFERFTSIVDRVEFNGSILHVVNPIGLSIIKRSHLWRDLSFSKHITQYHKHLSKFIRCYGYLDKELLKERTALTMQAYPQGHPNLNQGIDAFFDDAVTKKYKHDYLHELIAYYDKPLYTRLQTDSTRAWCKEELWNNLSHKEKVQCVAEEALVIAIERFMIPKDWQFPAKFAYMKAVDKICTTLCSGWFRDFAIDNYPEVLLEFNAEKINTTRTTLERI